MRPTDHLDELSTHFANSRQDVSHLPKSAGARRWGLRELLVGVLLSAASSSVLADITGQVFRDFNDNGIYDTAGGTGVAVDNHFAGVTVTAYDSTGAVAATATTVRCTAAGSAKDATGAVVTASYCTGADAGVNYSLPLTTGGPYRIEFTGLPLGFRSSAKAGATNATSVQFVTLSGGNATANAAFYLPGEYCQSNPDLATTCYVNGDPLGGNSISVAEKAIVGIPYSMPAAPTSSVPLPDVGSVWGLAYERKSKKLFSAATLRRTSGLGSLGIGGIYITDYAVSTGTRPTAAYIDLQTLVNVHDPVVGNPLNVGTNTARGISSDPLVDVADPTTFTQIGRVGIGDIDVSEDGSALWFTNLYDQKLYGLRLPASPAAGNTFTAASLIVPVTPPWLTTNPCTSGAARPWATKERLGKVYVGVVCTAEANPVAVGDSAAAIAAKQANLTAMLYAYDVGANSWSQIISFPMNYVKGDAGVGFGTGYDFGYYPWVVNYDPSKNVQEYPQAIFTDIEFDVDGSIIMGFLDRWGNIITFQGLWPDGTSAGDPSSFISGDILRLCNVGTIAAPVYLLENNGVCPGANSDGFNHAAATNALDKGPGGKEYYFGDYTDACGARVCHTETSLGGLALLAGTREVVMSAMDPESTTLSGGLKTLSNATGAFTQSRNLYNSNSTPYTGGKGNGIGDVELLCTAAPIEIGNRVWMDTNGNGVQDPDEPPLAGVTVHLYAPAGSGPDGIVGTADDVAGPGIVIGTAVTDVNGEYFFSSATGASTTNAIYGVTQLTPNTTGFTLSVDYATDYTNALLLQGKTQTLANSVASGGITSNDPLIDIRDSDAVLPNPSAPISSGNYPTITFNTGNAGENNHSLDFGFIVAPPVSLGNMVWYDPNNNGVMDSGEAAIAGVRVELFADADADGVPDSTTPIAVAFTDSNGKYLFTQQTDSTGAPLAVPVALTPGQYVVGVAPSNFTGTGPLVGRLSSGTTQDASGTLVETAPVAGNSDTNNADHGALVSTGTFAGYVLSQSITIVAGSEPTNDQPTVSDVPGSFNATAITDANSNLSIDFGFANAPVSVGNFVWHDANNNGIQDGGELPAVGVTATISRVDLAPVTDAAGNAYATTSINTDGSGQYLFNNLAAGQYIVTFSNLPTGFVATTTNAAGSTTANDSNGLVATSTVLTAGQSDLTLDLGLVAQAGVSVGNFVWLDSNGNGIQNAGEPGQPGVTVTISKVGGGSVTTPTGGAVVTTVQTDANGAYNFTNLAPGQYTVTFSGLPAGYVITTTNAAGSTTDLDSNGLTATSQVLASGQSDTSLDLGLVAQQGVAVGNFVWSDANGNGIQDAGEPGIGGITATISKVGGGTVTDVFGAPVTTTLQTDANGNYAFSNLAAGQYIVTFSNLPAGLVITTTNAAGSTTSNDSNGLTATSQVLAAGQSDLSLDLGLTARFALGNRVWLDANNNGALDAAEPGLDGLTVNLLNSSGTIVANTTTSGGGYYLFSNLSAGSYQVEIIPPAGHVTSTGTNGSATGAVEPGSTDFTLAGDNKDHGSAVNSGASIRSALVTLGAGLQPSGEATQPGNTDTTPDSNTNLTVDFGLFAPAKLGNLVWLDNGASGGTANNGVQDGSEPGLNGVTIRVLNAVGSVIATTVTANNPSTGKPGWYEVSNLVPGQYQVEFIPPSGYTFTTKGAAAITSGSGTDTNNSQANQANPRTALVSLAAGDNNPQLDAGLIGAGPTAVPTLSEWMLGCLALLMFVLAAAAMRKRGAGAVLR